jgi:hypothetical protein
MAGVSVAARAARVASVPAGRGPRPRCLAYSGRTDSAHRAAPRPRRRQERTARRCGGQGWQGLRGARARVAKNERPRRGPQGAGQRLLRAPASPGGGGGGLMRTPPRIARAAGPHRRTRSRRHPLSARARPAGAAGAGGERGVEQEQPGGGGGGGAGRGALPRGGGAAARAGRRHPLRGTRQRRVRRGQGLRHEDGGYMTAGAPRALREIIVE